MLVLVLLCSTWCPLQFCNQLDVEERAGCFTLVVFLVSCDCYYSVALPRVPVGWVGLKCDCGIS